MICTKIIACIQENFMFFIWQLTSLRKPKPLAINHPSLDVCLTKLSHWVDVFSKVVFWFSIHLFWFFASFYDILNSENTFKMDWKYTSIIDFPSLWLSSSRQEMIIKTKTWQVQQNHNEFKIFVDPHFLLNSFFEFGDSVKSIQNTELINGEDTEGYPVANTCRFTNARKIQCSVIVKVS